MHTLEEIRAEYDRLDRLCAFWAASRSEEQPSSRQAAFQTASWPWLTPPLRRYTRAWAYSCRTVSQKVSSSPSREALMVLRNAPVFPLAG